MHSLLLLFLPLSPVYASTALPVEDTICKEIALELQPYVEDGTFSQDEVDDIVDNCEDVYSTH